MTIKRFFGLVILATMLSVTAGPANAQNSGLYIDSYRDWALYTVEVDEGKVCYIASTPEKEEGNYTRRGAAAVLVTKWPIDGRNAEVSVQPGYTYLPDSTVQITIDDSQFELFTRGDHAWASSSGQDQQIIEDMKKGRSMTVRGTSTKETYSLDSYSLLGFTAAYKAMQDACG